MGKYSTIFIYYSFWEKTFPFNQKLFSFADLSNTSKFIYINSYYPRMSALFNRHSRITFMKLVVLLKQLHLCKILNVCSNIYLWMDIAFFIQLTLNSNNELHKWHFGAGSPFLHTLNRWGNSSIGCRTGRRGRCSWNRHSNSFSWNNTSLGRTKNWPRRSISNTVLSGRPGSVSFRG